MMAIELVKDRETREPWPEAVLDVVRRSLARGVIVLRAGLYSNCVRFLPPLDVPEDVLGEGLRAVAASVREAAAAAGPPDA
jgi:4-aminobutyrate aminotransferase/(S)-3-amino-2-methylpropionate transaminase